MPRWDASGGRKITTLFEAAAYQQTIEVSCRCSHAAVLNPHALWWHFNRKGWNDTIAKVATRLKCSRCPRRGAATIKLVNGPVTDQRLPLPPLHEWKRAVNRFRS